MAHDEPRRHQRWAELRFSIIGPLLAAPPARGTLRAALERLATTTWCHPMTGEPVRFGVSTIERWYYTARNAPRDPVGQLARKLRKDAGTQWSLSSSLRAMLHAQHRDHHSWSAQLHADNLAVLATEHSELGTMPSATTIRRYLKAQGLLRGPRVRGPRSPGMVRASKRLDQREVRSYEAEYVGGLWHADCHHGSRKVVLPSGRWATPLLLGILDDRSRLACHLQWYLEETAETLVHGLCQAFQKRGLPRALLTDNGGPMMASEVHRGLSDLGVVHDTTLPYSAYQNAKQEVFWASVEGRLLAMLDGVEELTVDLLNEATQAWGEGDYNGRLHSEIGTTPLRRFLDSPDVGRECPGSDTLRCAFRSELSRTQRRSDGTVSLEGRRFEIPSRYRTIERVRLRYARWDLRHVDLVDPRTGHVLAPLYPVDKVRNANARRRRLDQPAVVDLPAPLIESPQTSSGIAPLAPQAHGRLRGHGSAPGLSPQTLASRGTPVMNKKLLSLYGLKWNPFSPDLPIEALHTAPRLEHFGWRIEQNLVREGGFALITGEPGTGKSVALRLLAERLGALRDVTVGALAHPQSGDADFYREMGDLFCVSLRPHNRWGGFKALRERWSAHIESTLMRPVLLVDEAQEMPPTVLSELRLLTSTRFDSHIILAVVLAGDGRLPELLRRPDLVPLGSRIRTRLTLEMASRDELYACLDHLLERAGNRKLMTPELMHALCDHALGNYRVLTTMAAELLAVAAHQEITQLDEKLYLEVFQAPERAAPTPRRSASSRRNPVSELPVRRPHQLELRPAVRHWLVEGLWAEQAVGLAGGEPKCCKSFLTLDLAVAVATGAPALRRFPVITTGPVLLYAAEDPPHAVRQRLLGITKAAGVDFDTLDLHVITTPTLRLDLAEDQARLEATVARLRPKLLVLDPFVRLHRIDRNAAAEVAPLLSFLRGLQRRYATAVLLVHHARKGAAHIRGGQALRGSSELHAWGTRIFISGASTKGC